MKKFYQTKDFKKEKKKWYKKLRSEGFKDIEDENFPDTPFLKGHMINCINSYVRGIETGAQYYFRMASGWIWHGKFDDDWDKWIWEKHSEGYSERDIIKELNKLDSPFKPVSRFPINQTVAKVKEQMLKSDWFNNQEYDGYLSFYDTSMQLCGEQNE